MTDPLSLQAAQSMMSRWQAAKLYVLTDDAVQQLQSITGSLRNRSGVSLTVELIQSDDLDKATLKKIAQSIQQGFLGFERESESGTVRFRSDLANRIARVVVQAPQQPPSTSAAAPAAPPPTTPTGAVLASTSSTSSRQLQVASMSSQDAEIYRMALTMILDALKKAAEEESKKAGDTRHAVGSAPTTLAAPGDSSRVARPVSLERQTVDPNVARRLMSWMSSLYQTIQEKLQERSRKRHEDAHRQDEHARVRDERKEDNLKSDRRQQENVADDVNRSERSQENRTEDEDRPQSV